MDKIEKIRQEIERQINILTNVYAEQLEREDEEMMTYYHGKVIALEELLSFLYTLSEESDKGLEEEISRTYHDGSVTETEDIDHVAYENISRHFAEWGAEHLRDSTKMIGGSSEIQKDLEAYAQSVEDYYDVGEDRGYLCTHRGDVKDAVIAGARWQTEHLKK